MARLRYALELARVGRKGAAIAAILPDVQDPRAREALEGVCAPLAIFPAAGRITSVALSADGSLVAFTTGDSVSGEAAAFDVARREPLPVSGEANFVAFTGDGRLVVFKTHDSEA